MTSDSNSSTQSASHHLTETLASRDAAISELRRYLKSADLEFEESAGGAFAVTVPGEHRLKTTVSIICGIHGVSLNAFIVRNPDENHMTVYRWLLERNRKIYSLSYAIDKLGDIYLVGLFPHSSMNDDELDRIFGAVAENSDGMFDHLLELGFRSSIEREWRWRISRGESTRNLQAFTHIRPNDIEDTEVDNTSTESSDKAQ